MTEREPAAKATTPRRTRGWLLGLLLVVGVVVVPAVLNLSFGNVAAPDSAAYVRMAFATVAGSTIAITTLIAFAVSRIWNRSSWFTVVGSIGLALAVGAWQIAVIHQAADLLIVRLA